MIIDTIITEYDMKKAGPNILFDYGVIDKETRDRIINITDKKERYVETGNLLRVTPNAYQTITDGYKKYVELFIKENNIEKEHILEINNDAIWLCGFIPHKLKFGDNIEFVQKSTFTLVVRLKKKIKIYFSSNTKEIKSRGVKIINPEISDFYKALVTIFLMYESDNNNKYLYDRLHTIRNNLIKEETIYGHDLFNNIKNIFVIERLIKLML